MSRIPAMIASLFSAMLCAGPGLNAHEPPADKDDDYVARIYLTNPDGFGMTPLVNLPEYRSQGSPTWSSDGKWIAFDALRSQLGETLGDSKVILVNSDGTNPQILGDGCLPSFSPRAKRIAYSRYNANRGVWIMSVDKPDKSVLLDSQGWGARWSPDGRRIVYTNFENPNLIVYDLVEGTRESLFDAATAARYRSFTWNFKWSPDGRKIVFRGIRDGGQVEMGIVDARGAKYGLATRFEGKNITWNFAYRPDGRRILFSYANGDAGAPTQLYGIDPDTRDPPELLPGQDTARSNSAGAYSPDGKRMVIVSKPAPTSKK